MQKRFMSLNNFRKTKSYISFCDTILHNQSLALPAAASGLVVTCLLVYLVVAVSVLLTHQQPRFQCCPAGITAHP